MKSLKDKRILYHIKFNGNKLYSYKEFHVKEAIIDFKNCIKIMNKINRIGIIKNIDNDDYKIKQFYENKYNIEIFEIDELLLKIFGDWEK